jgi:hypothetical protein
MGFSDLWTPQPENDGQNGRRKFSVTSKCKKHTVGALNFVHFWTSGSQSSAYHHIKKMKPSHTNNTVT